MQYTPNPLPPRSELPDNHPSFMDRPPVFDKRDYDIVEISMENRALRNQARGPLVGDFVQMTDGTLRRFTHDWGDSLQVTVAWSYDKPPRPLKAADNAGFHLMGDGYSSYSGSLDPAIPRHSILPTTESLSGAFWIFHHNDVRAHNGIAFYWPVRVWKQV